MSRLQCMERDKAGSWLAQGWLVARVADLMVVCDRQDIVLELV
jgi:hypothetical protein